jgi:putative ABC transport system permease protein
MTVIERSREIGLLRAAGATARQIGRFVLTQALVVGVVGASLGLLLGAIFANAMVAYVRTIGDVVLDPPRLPVSSMLASLAVGVLVTLAAAAEPARRATRIAPVEALKARLDLPMARRARLRWLAFVFTIVALAGVALWPRGGDAAAVIRPVLIYVVLLGLTLSIPVLIPLLARVGGLPFRWPLVLEERLARATLVRDRGRATLTIGALAIGLALVVALGGVGEQARAAAGAWVADVVPGDVLVTSIRPVAPDEGVDQELAAVDGVARVSPIAVFPLAVDGRAIDGAAMVGQDLVADGRLTFVAGDRLTAFAALDAGGAAIVPAGLATSLGVGVGDTLTVAAVDGSTIGLKVVAVALRTLPGKSGEALIVGWGDATAHLGVTGADSFAVRFVPDAPAASREALADVATQNALEVTSLDQVRGAIDAALLRIFGLFDALSIIAVIVAALGIANTLTMDVIERVREIGVLRAAGMTRRQVWRSVVVEAGIVGLAGAILGSIGGVVVGALMAFLAAGGSTATLSVPWPSVGVALILGVVLAMLAAAYPAGLAARIPIVRAVSYE